MFRDRFILAGLAGLAGVIANSLVHWAAILVDVSHIHGTTGYYLATIMFARARLSPAEILLGELAHLTAGSMLGLTVLLMLVWTTQTAALVKGVGLGAVMWLNHVILVPSLVATRVRLVFSATDILIDLAALIAWSSVATYVLVRSMSAASARRG